MRRSRIEAAFALVLALVGAASADARVFQMSGQWTPRRIFGADLPVNPGFVPGMGLVTATGSAPARLTLQPGRFAEDAPGTLYPLPGMTLVQLSTLFDGMGPVEAAIFGPGPQPHGPRASSGACWSAAVCPRTTPPSPTARVRTSSEARRGCCSREAGRSA